MKAQILKIAGVKSEKEFYKKYPTEEAFMKAHRKEFKKAERGMKVAQMGQVLPNLMNQPAFQNQPDYSQIIGSQIDTRGLHGEDRFKSSDIGKMLPRQDAEAVNQVKSIGFTDDPAGLGGYGSLQPIGEENPSKNKFMEQLPGVVGGLIKGRSMLRGQRQERKKTEQGKALSELTLRASMLRPEESERRYVRPEDVSMTGEEFAPIYGTGTNVLARNGAEIQNTYAPKTIYDDLGYVPVSNHYVKKNYYFGGDIPMAQDGLTFEGFMEGGGSNMIGQIGEGLGNMASGNKGAGMSGGSQIGGTVGGTLGSVIGGPIGGTIGKFAGNIIGGALDGNARKIRKNQLATEANLNSAMFNYASRTAQAGRSGYMQYGGNVSMLEKEGDLNTLWGGDAETLSKNPFIQGGGETVMFRGNSHSDSDRNGNTGIGIEYGGSPVEVENGEPATEINNELVVFGNLKIPNKLVHLLEDEKAKGKKFKNYANDLSKQENKQNNKLEKIFKELQTLELKDSTDKLKMASLQANLTGAEMHLKSIADKKSRAAALQSAINDTAESIGVDADSLSKGKIKNLKNKKGIPTGQDGITASPTGYQPNVIHYDEDGRIQYDRTFDDYDSGTYIINDFRTPRDPDYPFYFEEYDPSQEVSVWDGIPVTNPPSAIPENSFQRSVSNSSFRVPEMLGGFETVESNRSSVGVNTVGETNLPTFQTTTPKFRSASRTVNSKDSGISLDHPAIEDAVTSLEESIRRLETKVYEAATKKEEETLIEEIQHKKSLLSQMLGEVLPYLRPSNVKGLDSNQLLGEMFAMSSNQLEPVQAQTFQPELSVPFEVSFQDAMNANQSDFRSMQRLTQGNPAAQAMLASQKYGANQQILGEQFRTNQAMKDRVYSENRQALNASKLANLQILDQQYERQAAAKSNTKATAQAAINSIASKYLQNDLENRRLAVWENMYNYRFDNKGRAVNVNAPADFYIPVLDGQGNVVGYRENPDFKTPPFNPNDKSSGGKNSETGKYGKTISSNGKVVKALKNI